MTTRKILWTLVGCWLAIGTAAQSVVAFYCAGNEAPIPKAAPETTKPTVSQEMTTFFILDTEVSAAPGEEFTVNGLRFKTPLPPILDPVIIGNVEQAKKRIATMWIGYINAIKSESFRRNRGIVLDSPDTTALLAGYFVSVRRNLGGEKSAITSIKIVELLETKTNRKAADAVRVAFSDGSVKFYDNGTFGCAFTLEDKSNLKLATNVEEIQEYLEEPLTVRQQLKEGFQTTK